MDDEGRALPLSHALVDAFQRQLLGARNKPPGPDEYNRRLIADRQAFVDRETERLHEEHAPFLERGRVGVSMATLKKRRYWQRTGGAR
jgi:hypothetical protein